MGDQGQRPCHPCASSSDGKGEQLRSSQQRDPRTEARTSRERLAARRSWNGHLLRIILWTGADVLFHICLVAFSKAPSCRCTRSLCENISHRKKPACALVSRSGPRCSAWRWVVGCPGQSSTSLALIAPLSSMAFYGTC